MPFLIGGLTPEQYDNCLYPETKDEYQWEESHWISHFNLVRYTVLSIIINRLTYFILHGFFSFPNNVYLFERFRSHDFTKFNNLEQVRVAKQICDRFKSCAEVTQAKTLDIGKKLSKIEDEFLKKEGKVLVVKEPASPGDPLPTDSESVLPFTEVLAESVSTVSVGAATSSVSAVPKDIMSMMEGVLGEEILEEPKKTPTVQRDRALTIAERRALRAEMNSKEDGAIGKILPSPKAPLPVPTAPQFTTETTEII